MKAIVGSCVEVGLSVGEKRDGYFSSSYFLIPCDLFEFPGVVCKRCKFLEKINFRDNAQKPFDRDIQLSLDSNGNFFGFLIDFIEHFDAIFLLIEEIARLVEKVVIVRDHFLFFMNLFDEIVSGGGEFAVGVD